MPRITCALSEGQLERLEAFKISRKDRSIAQTIRHLVDSISHLKETQRKRSENAANPRAPASIPSEYSHREKEKESNIDFRSANQDYERKSAPPDFTFKIPEKWEPSWDYLGHWDELKKRGLDYFAAIDLFRELHEMTGFECSDWNAAWRLWVKSGWLDGSKESPVARSPEMFIRAGGGKGDF